MLAFALSLSLLAAPTARDYDSARVNGNNAGLMVLGAESLISITAGAIGWARSDSDFGSGFWSGTFIWGLINAGFAVFGLYQGFQDAAVADPLEPALKNGRDTEFIYAINASFDVTYLAGAALLGTLDADRAKGFAKASLLQALFLCVFDSVMFAFHRVNNERALYITR